MKRIVVLVITLGFTVSLISCVSFGDMVAERQVGAESPYFTLTYNSTHTTLVSRQTILDFIAHDKTDENEYVEDTYTCQQFAADLWWNAYNKGIEGCIVWVYTNPGFHAVVKFNATDGWLWVDPETDFVSSKCWYEVWMTFCGENAFNKCVNTLGR
jgi:hypothetical protein